LEKPVPSAGFFICPHPSQLGFAPQTPRCDTFPLQRLRREGEGSWRMLRGEKRFAKGERNGPVDHFERRTPRAWASGRTALRNAALEFQTRSCLPGREENSPSGRSCL